MTGGEIHPLLKLGYFFSHRDFDWILDKKSKGESFYLYTGRGPSGMVHMGHLMPWIFTKYLQDKFDSLHEGWNEIHPIRDCQILGRLEPDENGEFKWSNFRYKDKETNTEFTLDSIESFKLLHDYWCAQFKGAKDAQDNGSTTNPVHDWGIHPTVDGCNPPIIIE